MRILGYLTGDSIGLAEGRFRVVSVQFRGGLGDEMWFRRPINHGVAGAGFERISATAYRPATAETMLVQTCLHVQGRVSLTRSTKAGAPARSK